MFGLTPGLLKDTCKEARTVVLHLLMKPVQMIKLFFSSFGSIVLCFLCHQRVPSFVDCNTIDIH